MPINYNSESKMERDKSRNRYKEFQPGDKLNFVLKSIRSDGVLVTEEKSIVIENIAGGGFFGKVLIPQD